MPVTIFSQCGSITEINPSKKLKCQNIQRQFSLTFLVIFSFFPFFFLFFSLSFVLIFTFLLNPVVHNQPPNICPRNTDYAIYKTNDASTTSSIYNHKLTFLAISKFKQSRSFSPFFFFPFLFFLFFIYLFIFFFKTENVSYHSDLLRFFYTDFSIVIFFQFAGTQSLQLLYICKTSSFRVDFSDTTAIPNLR